MSRFLFHSCSLLLILFSACVTQEDIRRQQEMERLKEQVSAARGDKVDVEVLNDEIRGDMQKLRAQMDEMQAANAKETDELKKQIQVLESRTQALEARAVAEETSAQKAAAAAQAAPKASFDTASKLYQEGKFEEASEMLRPLSRGKGEEAKKAHFLLAESQFAAKDYAAAALEYKAYRDSYPKDTLIPNAIYRQANCFRSMGKKKEAKLFYQELIEKYPKHALTAKAKAEMKKTK